MSLESFYYQIINPNRKFYHLLLFAVLKFVSLFYSLIVKVRVWFYQKNIFETRRLPVPVISVGNLTLGGTGKTPMAIWVAQKLLKNGFQPAILSRGYQAKTRKSIEIVSDRNGILVGPELSGDEPAMMARRLRGVPVIVGKDRYEAGMLAVEKLEVDSLILDDGYQRLDVKRDLNILLIDHSHGFENDTIFPAGTLRESLKEAKRADLVCFTRVIADNQDPPVKKYANVPIIKSQTVINVLIDLELKKTKNINDLKGLRVCAFCGIAQPEKFKKLLELYGAQVVSFSSFPDHHYFKSGDIKNVEEKARSCEAEIILTTEKDSVKLLEFSFSIPLFVTILDLNWLEGEEILNRLLSHESIS
jgi:tetraacyldisaccharide 4'-kinase